jgi:hypothetical protein
VTQHPDQTMGAQAQRPATRELVDVYSQQERGPRCLR